MSIRPPHDHPAHVADPHHPQLHAAPPHHHRRSARRARHLVEAAVLLGLFALALPGMLALVQKLPVFVASIGPPPARTPTDDDGDGLDDALEDQLLARHAPLALLAPDDPSHPANIDWLRAREEVGKGKPGPYGALVPAGHFSDATRRGSTNPADWTVYGHAYPAADGGVILQYWSYFPFNDAPLSPLFDHESDWEHVSVELDPFLVPRALILARHDRNAPGVRFPWDTIAKAGARPWFVVAAGTHAAYLNAAEAPFWERTADCPRRADGTPILDACQALTWDPGPGRPSPLVNVGERGAPRHGTATSDFLLAWPGLWGAAIAADLGAAAPAGPPFQRGFCAAARAGSCR